MFFKFYLHLPLWPRFNLLQLCCNNIYDVAILKITNKSRQNLFNCPQRTSMDYYKVIYGRYCTVWSKRIIKTCIPYVLSFWHWYCFSSKDRNVSLPAVQLQNLPSCAALYTVQFVLFERILSYRPLSILSPFDKYNKDTK